MEVSSMRWFVRARALVMVVGLALATVGAGVTPSAAAGPGVSTVSAGGNHTCALRTDSTVWCWGDASYGQLGDGTTGDANRMRTSPVRVRRGSTKLDKVTRISVGFLHSCALRTDRTVWCWGNAGDGQLGNDEAGVGLYRTRAVQVKRGSGVLGGVTQIAAGGDHTCALRLDGSVMCWGRASLGQAGDGTMGDASGRRTKAVRVRHGNGFLEDVVAIAAGYGHTCAAKADGSAYCWGDGALGQLGDGRWGSHFRTRAARVKRGNGSLANVSGLGADEYHACARRTNGTVWCWGNGFYGQLGDGTRGAPVTGLRTKAVQVVRSSSVLTGVTSVGVGAGHTCGRRSDGSAWCWGMASRGQLGDGTTGDPTDHLRLRPVRVVRSTGAFTGVHRIDGGDFHTCAVRTDKSVWCWGDNGHGQLGRGSFDGDPHPYPRRVSFP
jgi:alpha-tubulin suppressor-like RCC1 family protein